jgi:ATP-dependent RNA helicase RhlE
MPFSSFGLSAPLLDAVAHHSAPTPVQRAAIPVVLGGGDLLVTAETGSGKTTAYLLPLLERWLAAPRETPRRLHALILVPTRELAAQVRETVQALSSGLPQRIKVVSAVGGVSINPQMMALRGGADILVATPGRLLDLVDHNAVRLSAVKTLVLDEADRMLDAGFADEMGRILTLVPKQRQTLLFSATCPASVEHLAGELLREPVRLHLEPEFTESPVITERAICVDPEKRAPLLRHLLADEEWKRVLVFVATQYTADHVADKLRRNGISALAFHGDLSQGAREDVLLDFKNSLIRVLVATDLAARGLDIVKLPVVLNYDLPRSAVDYTHRIGRTGRAGKSGLAISFVTPVAESHFAVIEKRTGTRVAREIIPGFEPTPLPPGTALRGGGVKGHRKSKKDKLREAAAREKRKNGDETFR